jgi:four helix bundle protein
MEMQKEKIYDLEERTFNFAKRVRNLIKELPKTIINIEDGKQLIRSSGSIGANYLEANASLSKKDFSLRIKISLKEAKESRYWLSLLDTDAAENNKERNSLLKEAQELACIFGSIAKKSN